MTDTLDTFVRRRAQAADLLDELATALEPMGIADDAAAYLRTTAGRARAGRFVVLLIGCFSSGKSTLLNALLGQPVLPVKVNPCTAILTEVVYAEEACVAVHYVDGRVDELTVPAFIEAFQLRTASEDHAGEERADRFGDVDRAVVGWPLPLLRNGVVLLDTPGLDDDPVRTARTLSSLPDADAVIFTLSANRFLSDLERRTLHTDLLPLGLRNLFFPVTMVDLLDALTADPAALTALGLPGTGVFAEEPAAVEDAPAVSSWAKRLRKSQEIYKAPGTFHPDLATSSLRLVAGVREVWADDTPYLDLTIHTTESAGRPVNYPKVKDLNVLSYSRDQRGPREVHEAVYVAAGHTGAAEHRYSMGLTSHPLEGTPEHAYQPPNMDILDAKLDLDISTGVEPFATMDAKAVVTVTARETPIEAVELDLLRHIKFQTFRLGFEVSAVTDYKGRPLDFLHRGGGLVVRLRSPVAPGQAEILTIEYAGDAMPRLTEDSYGLLANYAWWPQPGSHDRVTWAVTICVPTLLRAAGTGTTVKTWTEKGKRCEEWVEPVPVSFPAINMGRWQTAEREGPRGVKIRAFFLSEDADQMDAALKESDRILRFYESIFGPYPFEELDLETAGTKLDIGVNQLLAYERFLSDAYRKVLSLAIFAYGATVLFEGQSVLANAIFGTVSGSAVASAAAVGSTMAPMQKRAGYDPAFSAAVNVASAPAGMLIPPSNTLIVYSLAAGGTSVGALFLAGYVPGILWALACAVVVFVYARRHPDLKGESFPGMAAFLTTLWRAVPSLGLIVVAIGGIVAGFFTPTEGSAIAVLYALGLSFVYRTISVKDLPRILYDACRTSAIVIFLIAVSTIMSYVMTYARLPQLIAESLFGWTDSKVVVLLIMMLVLLVIGIPLDPTPAILIFTPIFLPIAVSYGIDPVHFGIMMVFNLSIAVISPPSAPVLFVGTQVAKTRLESVIGRLWPFLLVLVVMLFVIVFVPQLSLWLPGLAGLL